MKTLLLLFVCGLILLSSCLSSQKEPQSSEITESSKATTTASPELKARMHKLSATIAELLPLVFSKDRFSEKKEETNIAGLLSELDGLAHGVEDQLDSKETSPALDVFAREFEKEISLALDSFRAGKKEYSRVLLRDTLSYCIQCHTRNSEGANFHALNLGEQVERMEKFSRAEFYAATRQFSRALELYKDILKDRSKISSMEWERISLHALAIAVRYLRSPDEALEIVHSLDESRSSPYYVQKDIKAWEKSLTHWKKSQDGEQKLTDQALLTTARTLLAMDKEGEPASASAIEYLRASALIHQYLEQPRTNLEAAEGLFYLGRAYSGVRQFNLSNFEEKLFEACIRKAPHTETAQKCYSEYQETLLVGFSGSGGLSLPADVQKKMKRYEELASPQVSK